jgi:Domain of unknown function (DUF4157)
MMPTPMVTEARVARRVVPPAPCYARHGASLPAALRRDLEPAFGCDFAGVRIHTDADAARETRRLGARAFTIGRDIWFSPGAYAPATLEGRRLLAHELTHVVQQAGTAPAGEPPVGATDTPAEREAATVADRVGAGRPAGPVSTHRPIVQRQPDPDAPTPAGLPIPLQAGWSPSTPGVFSIHVDSGGAQPRDAWGSASSRGVFPLSAMGRLEHFCSTPANYPLRIRFYTDSAATPRPQPFRPPALSVVADFTPSGGSPRRIAGAADAAPRYAGAGWPLAPAFGELFTASSSQSGVLSVQATLRDPDTSTTVAYRDTVACELVPCA